MSDELKDILRRVLDEEDSRREERLQYLEAKFKNDPELLEDSDRLELIGYMCRSPEIEPAQYFEALVTQLSFSNETIDPDNLKTAWKEFLNSGASCDAPTSLQDWNLTCDRSVARQFERFGKAAHSISVYEHILSEIVGGDPNYRDGAEDCLFRLFDTTKSHPLEEPAKF